MAFRRQYIYDLSFLFPFLSYGRSRPQERRLRMMMMIPWDTMFFPSLLIEPQLCNEASPPGKKARRLFHFHFHFTSSVQRAGFACLLARRKPHGSNTCTLSRLPHTWNVPGPQATDRLLACCDRAGRYLFRQPGRKPKDRTDLFPSGVWRPPLFFSPLASFRVSSGLGSQRFFTKCCRMNEQKILLVRFCRD
jgi:hypothetical protein